MFAFVFGHWFLFLPALILKERATWSKYGEKIGFGVRKKFKNKWKEDGVITSYRYVCYKEGIRKLDKKVIELK